MADNPLKSLALVPPRKPVLPRRPVPKEVYEAPRDGSGADSPILPEEESEEESQEESEGLPEYSSEELPEDTTEHESGEDSDSESEDASYEGPAKTIFPCDEESYSIGLSRMSAREPFTYDKLKGIEFRTIRLVTGCDDDDDSLQAYIYTHISANEMISQPGIATAKDAWHELDYVSNFDGVEDSVVYEALSYTWGSDRELFPLFLWPFHVEEGSLVCDAERAGFVHIQKNLWDFLVHSRQMKWDRFIWIDALSINQQDIEDKQLHLVRMKWIYRYSKKVWIWLGQGSEAIDYAFEMLPFLTKTLLAIEPRDTWTVSDIQRFPEYGLPEMQDTVWEGLRAILKHPWWSRIWTLQEVNNTRHPCSRFADDRTERPAVVLCGRNVIPLPVMEVLTLAASRAGLEDWIISGRTDQLVKHHYAFDGIKILAATRDCSRRGTIGLRVLLQSTRRRYATFAQDIVLGQAGLHYLSSRRWARELGVSLGDPPHSVFLRFGKHYLSQEIGECLLNHVDTREKLAGLPSWCPNLASHPRTFCLGSRWRGLFRGGPDGTPWVNMPDCRAYHAGFKQKGKWKMPITPLFWVGKAWVNIFSILPTEVGYFNVEKSGVQVIAGTDYVRCAGVELDVVTHIVDCNSAVEEDSIFNPTSLDQTKQWLRECLEITIDALSRTNHQEYAAIDAIQLLARTVTANRIRLGERLVPKPLIIRAAEKGASYKFEDGSSVLIPYQKTDEAILDTECEVDFKAHMLEFLQYCSARGDTESCTTDLSLGATNFARMLQRITRHRRFFATKDGRIGIGSADTRIGDVLCVILFCPTPYLLRAAADNMFELVCEVYTHGLMYGEALDMLDQGKVPQTSWIVK